MNDHASILAQQARENLRQTACFQAFCKSCGQQNSTARTVSSKVLGGKKLEQPWQGCALPTELLPHHLMRRVPSEEPIQIDREFVERETSLELATSTLARLRSTN